MSEPNNSNGIGGPEPIDRSDPWSILIDIGGIVALACSGYLAFSTLARPRALAGATRSAMLQWQQRKIAVEQTVSAAEQSQEARTASKEDE